MKYPCSAAGYLISTRKRLGVGLLGLAVLGTPASFVNAQPVGIPSMGVASAAELSPGLERTLGDAIMEQGRRDPTYIADPDVLQYLPDMGRNLPSQPDTPVDRVTVFPLR